MSLSKHKSIKDDQLPPPDGKINVTILASEWGSSKGGLSTLNRELAIQLAKFPEVKISFFVPKCSEQDKIVALSHNIEIVQATRRPGYDELEWLSLPPDQLQIDAIVGHGVTLGRQAQFIRKSHKCKWIQVVHTDPEELGMFKTYQNPISTGEKKRKTEVELCEMADFVIGVGPKLCEAFRRYLRYCKKDENILEITPGVFDEFLNTEHVDKDMKRCGILVFGRGDAEDFELKGFDIAGKAVAEVEEARLTFVGAPKGKHEDIAERFLKCGVPADRLTIRSFLENRESLKHLFCEMDLVLMPSRTEGFGLTGLEALSAGLPVLVSKNSGFGEALSKVPFGESCVIDSEDSKVWADEIKKVWRKNRKRRLQEVELLRSSYGKMFSWATQSKVFVNKIIDIFQDASVCKVSAAQRQHQSSSLSLSQVAQKDGDQRAATSIIPDQKRLIPKQRTHKEIERLDLKKIAAAKGFIICDNPASGNCVFHALSQQLKRVKGINISHEEIRKDSVRFLENFPNLPDGTELFKFVHGYPSWSDYLRSMEKDGTWGDHVILHAAANVLNTRIRVISSLGSDVMISPNHPGVNLTNPLVVGHIHEMHYVSLQPKQDASVCELRAAQHQQQPSGVSLSKLAQEVKPTDFDQHAVKRIIHDLQQLSSRQQTREESELSRDLQKNIVDKGFVICDNSASGNCIFFVLSQQLQSVREINISHKEIRKDLVQFLENFPKLPDETELFNFVHGYPSWSDYLRSMEKDGTWGDHVILYAAANFYKTCIRVISSLGYDFMITPNYPSVIKPYPLVAGHIHEEHFVSLRLKQDIVETIERVRELYKIREERLLPVPWCEHFSFSLNDIFTRLRIVAKDKTRGEMKDDITDMTAIFKTHGNCEKPRTVLIEGDPGMGKTTYCQKLAYDWATSREHWDNSFPMISLLLLLRCHDIKSNLWEAIDEQLLPDDMDEECKESFFKFIRGNQSWILFVLDGLDEADHGKIDMFINLAQSKKLPKCLFVFTSRHESGMKMRSYCNNLWEIVGFTEEDAEHFIHKYFKNMEHLAKRLLGEIRRRSDLSQLISNPLNTALLCILCEDFKEAFPESRTHLYIEMVRCVLRRYEEKNGFSSDNEDIIEVYEDELRSLGRLALQSLLKACCFRFNGFSVIYLCCLLAIPILPNPSQGPTGHFQRTLLGLSVFALMAQIIFQIVLAALPPYGHFFPNCSTYEQLTRQIGLSRFDGVSALHVFRIIAPDVVVIVVSITCVVCCRGLVDSSALHSTTPQHIRISSDSSSWDNVMPYFIAVMLLAGGIMLPSLASAIYFIMFLILGTMWACHKAVRLRRKTAFASVRLALMVYSGLHVLTFYMYQFQFFQKALPPESLLARLFGLVGIIYTDCSAPLVLHVRPFLDWPQCASPGVILTLYWLLATETRYYFIHDSGSRYESQTQWWDPRTWPQSYSAERQGVVKPILYVGAVSNAIQIGINALMVYVLKWGFRGIAICWSFTNVIIFLLTFAYMRVFKLDEKTWPGWTTESLLDWGQFIKLAVTGMVMICIEWWSFEIGSFLAGSYGEYQLATYGVIFQWATFHFMIPLGISIAAGVRVGNALGAGHPDAAKRAAKVAIGLIVCIDLVVFAIFFGLQDMSGRVFTDNSEVLSLYTKNIRFMSAYFLFDGVQGVCSGIIRGSGRQTIGVLINFLAYCCIGLPCGITLMFLVFHEITGLWIGLGIGVLTQASLYVILLWRTDWEKQAQVAKGRTAGKAAVYNTSETWIDVEVSRRERDAMLSSWIYKTSSLPFLRRFHAGNNHFELLTSDENKRTECNGELELMQEDNASGRACDANHLIRLISSEKKSLIRKRLIPLGISLLILGATIVVRFLVPLPPSYETATVGNKTVSGNITGNLTTQAPLLTNLDKTIF